MKVVIGRKKYKLRESLDGVPCAVLSSIFDNIENKKLVVALWLKANPLIIESADINQIHALYNIIMNRFTACEGVITTNDMINLESIKVRDYCEIDAIMRNEDNYVVKSLKVMDIVYKKKPKKIDAKFAMLFFNFIIKWKDDFRKRHTVEADIREDRENDDFAESWGWYHILQQISDMDILKFNAWMNADMSSLFTHIEYVRQWQEIQKNG